jgi:hypothetical protein
VIRAHEAGNDKVRMAELSMALSHRLVELAADGVTDPQELRRLALETFPLVPPPENQSDAPKETALGGHTLRPLQKCPRLPKREETMDKEKENKGIPILGAIAEAAKTNVEATIEGVSSAATNVIHALTGETGKRRSRSKRSPRKKAASKGGARRSAGRKPASAAGTRRTTKKAAASKRPRKAAQPKRRTSKARAAKARGRSTRSRAR